MGKIVLYTQRVEAVADYGERRDCADQQIAKFLWDCGFTPVPVGNLPEHVEQYADQLCPAGIVLTGGNDLEKYGGNAPERDRTERTLLEYALSRQVPLIGFCRGMQIIADYFGNPLQRVEGHVGCRHTLTGGMPRRMVNSFHRWGLKAVSPPIHALASAEDGVIEAICHEEKRMMGIMWHPEREMPYAEDDVRLFSDFLEGNM